MDSPLRTGRRFVLPLLLLSGAVVVAFPFLFHLAGDAQVHLAVAERFAAGEPFRYNPGGEIVVASTSPFWTAMLTTFFLVAGRFTPLLLKGVVVLIWLAGGVLLVRSGVGQWHLGRAGGWALAFLWLAHTTIVANALGGLENVLAAGQLLWLYQLAGRYRQHATPGRLVVLGLLWGWMILTRPDAGLLGAVVILFFFFWRRRQGMGLGRLVVDATVMSLAALALNVPWYAFQYTQTGQVVTDSSLARLYGGRQGSLPLLPPALYLHPKTIISLGTAFLPLSVGATIFAGSRLSAPGRGGARPPERHPHTNPFESSTALALVAGGVLFYTFGVGAEAFGRYFLPLFPFFFLLGVAGWQILWQALAAHSRSLALLALTGAVIFMAATGTLDYLRRTVGGRIDSGPVLNVIYGPANRRYFSYNLDDLIQAPTRREAATDEVLAALGAQGSARIAVTEVQLRYFVDRRVTILSLDGRTSAQILPYFDPESGIPDFGAYFEAERPDYVHANQWCRVGGWLRALSTSALAENVVCRWQRRLSAPAAVDAFTWQGRTVRKVAPEIVKIEW